MNSVASCLSCCSAMRAFDHKLLTCAMPLFDLLQVCKMHQGHCIPPPEDSPSVALRDCICDIRVPSLSSPKSLEKVLPNRALISRRSKCGVVARRFVVVWGEHRTPFACVFRSLNSRPLHSQPGQ